MCCDTIYFVVVICDLFDGADVGRDDLNAFEERGRECLFCDEEFGCGGMDGVDEDRVD